MYCALIRRRIRVSLTTSPMLHGTKVRPRTLSTMSYVTARCLFLQLSVVVVILCRTGCVVICTTSCGVTGRRQIRKEIKNVSIRWWKSTLRAASVDCHIYVIMYLLFYWVNRRKSILKIYCIRHTTTTTTTTTAKVNMIIINGGLGYPGVLFLRRPMAPIKFLD